MGNYSLIPAQNKGYSSYTVKLTQGRNGFIKEVKLCDRWDYISYEMCGRVFAIPIVNLLTDHPKNVPERTTLGTITDEEFNQLLKRLPKFFPEQVQEELIEIRYLLRQVA